MTRNSACAVPELIVALSPGHLFRPDVLLTGAGVALSAALAWSLDLATLRRLPARIVAVLQSLEPAAGALAGLIVARQHLTGPQWLAIGCVTAAAIGAVATAPVEKPPRRASASCGISVQLARVNRGQ